MNFNIRVLVKEPRGFTRILEAFFAVLAWSTIRNFSTISKLTITCPPEEPTLPVELKIEYPFDFTEIKVDVATNCTDDADVVPKIFPIDFSSVCMLYVLLCMISALYALSSLFYYSAFTAKYETDPLAPMVDLGITFSILVIWILLTLLWALNVSDLKHYTHPNNFKEHLSICESEEAKCETGQPGKWTALTVSIVCGFTCIVLWSGSTWFIFKETTLHKKQPYQTSGQPMPAQPPNQPPMPSQ